MVAKNMLISSNQGLSIHLPNLPSDGEEYPQPLAAVQQLVQSLSQQGIRYCHWKSNVRLLMGMQGQTDLDLLVDRDHQLPFEQILTSLNIKRILPPSHRDFPGIENYLGFDPTSGKLFHLHVHYNLVLGEEYVKNYHLPLEKQFLDSVRPLAGVCIPAAELEIIVLVLRILLKYRDRDAFKDILAIRSPGIKQKMRQEVLWLLEQTSLEQIASTLKGMEDVVPSAVVMNFLHAITGSSRNGYLYLRLRQQTRRALHSFQRKSRWQASLNYFKFIWQQRKSFFKHSSEHKMVLPGGGITLAMIGVDGSGKSTLSQMTTDWLSWKLDVHRYYMGSKQPSLTSRLFYSLFRAARRSHRSLGRVLGEKNIFCRMLENMRQLLLYSHHLFTGLDRYSRYRNSIPKANNGSIVLYDRYPLVAPLDGPVIHQLESGSWHRIQKRYSAVEQKLYEKMDLPEYIIVMKVSRQISTARKPDHSASAIQEKLQVLDQILSEIETVAEGPRVIPIDASLPLETVFGMIKREIWNLL
jgi:thymidylate kinase